MPLANSITAAGPTPLVAAGWPGPPWPYRPAAESGRGTGWLFPAAKSASRIRLREADKFSDVTCRLLMEVSNRDCKAPSLARSPLIKARAESTVFSALVDLVNVVTSRLETFFSVEFGQRLSKEVAGRCHSKGLFRVQSDVATGGDRVLSTSQRSERQRCCPPLQHRLRIALASATLLLPPLATAVSATTILLPVALVNITPVPSVFRSRR